MIRRTLLAAILAVAPTALLPCMDVQVPQPARPSDGIGASIDSGPAKVVDGNPFEPGAKVTIYEVYGYGPSLHDYDNGCLSGGFSTGFANLLNTGSQALIASVTALTRFIFDPNFLAVLTPVFEFATQAFGYRFFIPLLAIAVAFTGLWIMAKQARGKVADAANSAGGVVLVVVIAAFAILYPVTIGAAADAAMSKAIGVAADTMSGSTGDRDVADSVASTLTEALVYEPWVSANFGRGNAQAAEEYGAALWATATLTRAEEAKIAEDPDAAGDILDAKKEDAEELVGQIKEAYPGSYPYLAGQMGKARVGYAMLTAFAAVSALFFLAYSLYRVLFAMVFVRVAVALTPLVAIAAQHPRWRWMMLGLLNAAGWVVLSSTAFAVVSLILIGAGQAALLSVESGLAPLPAALLLFLLNVAVWVMTKKLRQGGPMGMAFDALRGRKPRVPELLPEDALGPDPHVVPQSRPAAPPPESSFVRTAATGAAYAAGLAAVTAATGGAGTAAAAKVGATAAAKTVGAQAITNPGRQLPAAGARSGVVMHTPATLDAQPAAAPAGVNKPVVIQGEVVRPESTATPLRTMRAQAGESWEPKVHTPAPAPAPESNTADPRKTPARVAVPAARLYQIGK